MFHPFPTDREKAILRAQGLLSLNPLFLDTETTGLSDMEEICEIAIIDVVGQVLINTLVKPTKRIPHSSTEIHGISDETVAGAPTFRDLVPSLDQILRGRIVIAYNMEFDIGKLARSARANGFNLDGDDGFYPWWMGNDSNSIAWDCAMEMYAMYYGDWNDYHSSYRWQRLSTALGQCGIELPQGIHRAHADAEMTRRLMLHLAQQQLPAVPMEGDPNA